MKRFILATVLAFGVTAATTQRANAVACGTGFFPGEMCSHAIRSPLYWLSVVLSGGGFLLVLLEDSSVSLSHAAQHIQSTNPGMKLEEAQNLAALLANAKNNEAKGMDSTISLGEIREAAPEFAATDRFSELVKAVVSNQSN